MVIILVFCVFTTRATRWQHQFVSTAFKEGNLDLCKINSKTVYDTFVKNIQEMPTELENMHVFHISSMVETDVDWKCVYNTLYNTSIDTRLRAFQFKIINNIPVLPVNSFRFK